MSELNLGLQIPRFTIKHLEVRGLWGLYDVSTALHHDLSIFIGSNGCGKTTLLNIIQNVLSVDVLTLETLPFSSATLVFTDRHSTKILKVSREVKSFSELHENDADILSHIIFHSPDEQIPFITYHIDGNEFKLPVSGSYRRISYSERWAAAVRDEITKVLFIKKVRNISVYRHHGEKIRERGEDTYRRSNIDERIGSLMIAFNSYREMLNQKVTGNWEQFKLNVIRAMLESASAEHGVPFKISDYEADKLQNIIKALGLETEKDRRLVKQFVESYRIFKANLTDHILHDNGAADHSVRQMAAYSVFGIFDTIIGMFEDTQKKNSTITSPIKLFLDILNGFLEEQFFGKTASLDERGLIIYLDSTGRRIKLEHLSSGEKQLLIILLETIIERNNYQILIIDEPEISLNLQWQHDLLRGIMRLNPNAQIFIATQAPELVSEHSNKYIRIGKCFRHRSNEELS